MPTANQSATCFDICTKQPVPSTAAWLWLDVRCKPFPFKKKNQPDHFGIRRPGGGEVSREGRGPGLSAAMVCAGCPRHCWRLFLGLGPWESSPYTKWRQPKGLKKQQQPDHPGCAGCPERRGRTWRPAWRPPRPTAPALPAPGGTPEAASRVQTQWKTSSRGKSLAGRVFHLKNYYVL